MQKIPSPTSDYIADRYSVLSKEGKRSTLLFLGYLMLCQEKELQKMQQLLQKELAQIAEQE